MRTVVALSRVCWRVRWATIALLIVVAAGCEHKPGRFLPTSPDVVDSLTLATAANSMPADGFSRVEITALINDQADADKRTVVFTTTAGTFTGATEAGSDGRTKKVPADSLGVATTHLQSSSTVEIAVIEASIDGVDGLTKRTSIEFTAPAADTLRLEASVASVPADGFSTIDLTATIDPSNPPDKSTVRFAASEGTLLGANVDAEGNLSVDADLEGIARAQLRSSQTVGFVQVEATLVGVPGAIARLQVEFEPVDPSQIITLSAGSSSAPADGSTLTAIFADISPSLPTGNREVRFETNMGTFAGNSTVVADASNRATVDLRSAGTLGQARIRATVSSTSAEIFLDFVRAQPDRVIVLPDKFKFSVANDTQIGVTARLERNVGSVTDGTSASYSIEDAITGDPIPDVGFQGVTTSSNGSTTATLVLGTGAMPSGFALIRVRSGGVSGEETIEFVP